MASIEAIGVTAVKVRTAAELDAIDGLIIPGGESTTMLNLLRTLELWDPLYSKIQAGLPVYGSCAGMIMLASHIQDGRPDQVGLCAIDMVVRRNAFGRQTDSFEQDLPVFGADQPPMRAVFIRAPWVEKCSADVQILAQVHLAGQEHPVAVRQNNALATSFHPEVTGDLRIHEYFVDMVRRHASLGASTR